VIKPGRYAVDPLGRSVRVLEVKDGTVIVRLAGSYGATVRYALSAMREARVENRCPNCGETLQQRRCKQHCPSCGYFDDCSIGPA